MVPSRLRGDDDGRLHIGPLEADENDAALDCLGACFGFDPDPERWRRLYRESPAGPAVIVVARCGGIVVSGVALLPRPITFFGRHGIAGHELDSMTRPEWRGMGVRSVATDLARHIASERGLLAVFSFANESSLPGSVRQRGRRRVSAVPLLVRPLLPAPGALMATLARGVRLFTRDGGASDVRGSRSAPSRGRSRPVQTSSTGRFPTIADGVDPRSMRDICDSSKKRRAARRSRSRADAAHLTWRCARAPGMPYRQRDVYVGADLVASAVARTTLIFGCPEALLMESSWKPGARGLAIDLLRDAVRSARRARLDGVAALATPSTSHRRMLLRLGFVPVPAWCTPRRVTFNVGPELEDEDAAQWYEPSNWQLSFGDGFLL